MTFERQTMADDHRLREEMNDNKRDSGIVYPEFPAVDLEARSA